MALQGSLNVGVSFTDSTGTTIYQRVAGIMQQSIDAGQTWTALGGLSGEAQDMFKARAQTFVPPDFHVFWEDYIMAPTDVIASGFTATSAVAAVTTGRAGGSKAKFTFSGAAGFHYEAITMPQLNGNIAIAVGNIAWDPWYVESQVRVNTSTGSSEAHLIGLYTTAGAVQSTEAGSQPYITLGMRPAISATFLTLSLWQGGAGLLSTVTTIPFEVGQFRKYAIANDGSTNIYVLRDGVIMGPGGTPTATATLPVLAYQGAVAWPTHFGRALGGAIDYDIDYFACAAPSL